MRRVGLLALALAALLPASAQGAATVSKAGDQISFTSGAGEAASLTVVHPEGPYAGDAGAQADDVLFIFDVSVAPALSGPCVISTYDPPDIPPFITNPPRQIGVRCDGDANDSVVVTTSSADDFVSGRSFDFLCGSFFSGFPCTNPTSYPLRIEAGEGNDVLDQGNGPNTLLGQGGDDLLTGGPVVDVIDGGDGRDLMNGGFGADDLRGGAGIDEVNFPYTNDKVLVTLDDQANDGAIVPALEADNVHSDIEDVTGSGGNDDITGSGKNNQLTGGAGDDRLDGGGGFDAYFGEEGSDTLLTRDGNRERVDCGDGSDLATVDTGDQLSGCEVPTASDELEGDLDRDGFKEPADCNDRDDSIKPGATDAPDNGVDEDCSGADATIRDRDGDGFVPPADCDDVNAAIRPGAVEIFGNTVDEDCNGRADPLQSISSVVRASFAEGATTSVRRLRAAGLRAGTVVRVTCKGKRSRDCPTRTRDFPVVRDTSELDLRGPLKIRRLRSGVKLTIDFLRADSLTKRYVFTFRTRKLPRTSITCQQAGSGRFRTCP